MPITIPHLGNVYLAAKALFDGLGIEYILPEQNSRSVLQTGSFYSPDEMCLPFKLMMGNYIDAISRGADTILITGSCGPCRFGEYCELQMRILKDLGHDLRFVVVDSPGEIGKDEFLTRIGIVSGESKLSRAKKVEALLRAVRVMKLLDRLEAETHELAGFEAEHGACKRILERCKADMLACTDPAEMIHIMQRSGRQLDRIAIDPNKEPLRIAVIGEIYTVIEPFTNLFIEDRLMDLGVSTERSMTPTWWLTDMVLKPPKLNSPSLRLASRPYLKHYVGGHCRECIGEAMMAQRKGLDGAIQIFPMGCMPEIVAKAILPSISRDRDFPILTLIVDEMTGEAGYVTRIEAFLDMLERRRKVRQQKANG